MGSRNCRRIEVDVVLRSLLSCMYGQSHLLFNHKNTPSSTARHLINLNETQPLSDIQWEIVCNFTTVVQCCCMYVHNILVMQCAIWTDHCVCIELEDYGRATVVLKLIIWKRSWLQFLQLLHKLEQNARFSFTYFRSWFLCQLLSIICTTVCI